MGRGALVELGNVLAMLTETIAEAADRIRRGRPAFRWSSFFAQAQRVGFDSIPLVAMVSFFLGLTMALMTGYQLKAFGTDYLVPSLVTISFTRELGPLMTGIVVAARVGASFTAEIGTMTVSEEVEAIESMGLGPLRFLVGPRLAAVITQLPCLSVISVVAALTGCFVICQTYLSITFPYFQELVIQSIYLKDVLVGVVKSLLFGLIIGSVGCYKGLTVRGGAAGVGAATTSSVVTAITVTIACDTLVNIITVVTE